MLRLNLGCGFKKYLGYFNVDLAPECEPDQVVNLEQFPWPWASDSVDEIKLEHVLEHLGETSTAYIAIWQELWRVSKPDALVDLIVPHWNHENFHHDPTHVRPITPIGVAMFDQQRNIRDAKAGGRETKLGLFAGVDLELTEVKYVYHPEIANALATGSLSEVTLNELLAHQNNVCEEIRMKVRIIKPARGHQPLGSEASKLNLS